jgi:16S rRNA (uracil1498-N3)-methyltransferase
LVLCEARKVPKDYFGSHLFRHPERLRERLIEGLCQAGDVRLPRLTIVRNLKGFLRDELDDLFPCETYARVLAHPERIGENRFPVGRFDHLSFPETDSRRIVLAVGPEGGWVEPDELDLWDSHNFQAATLGPRVLRSDVAVVALLALAHEACRAPES